MPAVPELSIILVNHRRATDTIECVRSLRQSTYKGFELIIVDNGSGDESIDQLRRECPEARLIVNESNMGFAEGNNAGIRESTGSEFILLLNNDTIVDPAALSALVQTLKNDPAAAIVGAKIYYFDRPNVLWFAGGHFNQHSTFGGHDGLNEEDCGAYDTLRPCDFVTGCCLLFRRQLVNRVGLLERSYFAYLEDVEFCIRTRAASYLVMYQPQAKILPQSVQHIIMGQPGLHLLQSAEQDRVSPPEQLCDPVAAPPPASHLFLRAAICTADVQMA